LGIRVALIADAFEWLTVVDQFTKDCVALHTKPRLLGSDVAEALDLVIRERGNPPGTASHRTISAGMHPGFETVWG